MILRRFEKSLYAEFCQRGCISASYNRAPILFRSLRPESSPFNQLQRRHLYVKFRCQEYSVYSILKHRKYSGSPSSETVKFNLPDIGEGISEVVIKGWIVKVGDKVEEFDGICKVESDKATVTISSRFRGTISKVHYDEGATAKVGKPLVDIRLNTATDDNSEAEEINKEVDEVGSSISSQKGKQKMKDTQGVYETSIVPTLPSVRRLAKKHCVDLSKVTATGKNNRVLKEDVLSFIESLEQSCHAGPRDKTASVIDTIPKRLGAKELETRHSLSSIKQAMFKTMTQALQIPHFNYCDEFDVTDLMDGPLINKIKSQASSKVSILAVIIKMTSLALTRYPMINASIDVESKQMVQKNYHNIGVAVDTEQGLLVPNIKDVQHLSIRDINSELLRLRQLGYSSKLSLNDLSGGTFTLSNIGSIGGLFGVPVILPPEIVIGALGRTQRLPRFADRSSDQIVARHIMRVVWSADHRVVDGATLSKFSNLLKSYLEDSDLALLDLI